MKEEGLKESQNNIQGGGMILPQIGDSHDIGMEKEYQDEEDLNQAASAAVANRQPWMNLLIFQTNISWNILYKSSLPSLII